MKVTPKTDKELAEAGLWPVGVYGFEILDATDEVSKSGNEMIKLKVAVYNSEGAHRIMFDYLLDAMAHKVKHVSDVCGLSEKYLAGSITADDFKGKSGNLKLRIKKDKAGAYPDKNEIVDYVTGKVAIDASAPVATPANGAAFVDDSIPFMAHQAFILA